MQETRKGKISLGQKIAYGSGDMSVNILFAAISFYLLYFFVNVGGLKAGLASVVFIIARAWDAVTDYMMGRIVDKTKFGKWGKRKFEYKLVNLGMQLVVTTVSVFIIVEIAIIVFGNYFMRLLFQSRRDMMTLLFNKSTFIRHVNASISDTSASSHLLILDVDNFKRLNDTYGHPNGDKVLIGVAHILKSVFEDSGVVGRLGGDEFSVFCEDIPQKDIEELANQICSRVSGMKIHGVHGISCSIGVALCCPGEGFADVYPRADEALYKAKEMGKNRYFLDPSAPETGR